MYRFSDRKGRTFALRPEGTAPVIRSYIENNLGEQKNILKLFYIGSMFRYDRPQAGRSRQFSQYGIECIGSNHPYYDAETIAVFYTFLQTLSLKHYTVEINSIGCENCSRVYNNALAEYYQTFFHNLCSDCKNRFEKNPKRLLDCKVDTCKKYSFDAPIMLDHLDSECHSHFEQVQQYLDIMKVPFVINPRIVRGLDYYTQTAFEFINNQLGAQNALGGGGRYNSLIEQMGGKNTPAIGFAGGFSRLIMSIEKENINMGEYPKPKYYIVTFGDETTETGIQILNYLRNNGVYVEFDIEKTSMKAQMKNADKYKASHVIIIGDDEQKSGLLTIKDMTSGTQTSHPIDKIADLI
jgi:histidyl-tRNA synthetase